ncbi:helix-turn-helix transcriptional regulator [Alcaligenaceae bacterium CGII-47]|nr:helix-turn-helix transcriptional regulator [Alcaligenaceae bacterium CGII-47]
MTGNRSEMARLVFPAMGVLIVSSPVGNWVVSSAHAIWLAPNITHDIRILGSVRMKSFYFDPTCAMTLPEHSCVVPVSPLLREIFRSLAEYPTAVGRCRRTRLMGELMIEKIVSRLPSVIHLPEPHDARLAAVCEDIQLSPDNMKTLQQYADELGCSARTLHRLFLDEMGVSFTVWRHHAKLLLALQWLARGRSILSISLDLGYQNQSAFTAMFRKYMGASPSQFSRTSPRVLQ